MFANLSYTKMEQNIQIYKGWQAKFYKNKIDEI